MKTALLVWGLLLTGLSTFAELALPEVFSDGMVLQRDQKVPVWGWAEPGVEVTVLFSGQAQTGRADAAGKFMVRLKKMKASAESQVLKVKTGDESIEVKNVLVGEVWLCSGQSNMYWPVSKAQDFEKEKVSADYPQIRMFLQDLKASKELEQDCPGSWRVCTPERVGAFSATAYFFGRELHKELDVPVGLIRTCWGGSRIEAWMPMPLVEKRPAAMEHKAREDRKPKGGSPQHYPANLYNAMLNPLVPYGIRGAIWYQGESNAKSLKEAVAYRGLLESMVQQWRKDWDAAFPFYFVQLPNFKAAQTKPVEDTAWAFIRDAFMQVHKTVPDTGMAIAIDVGEARNIHPKNKQAAGYRLAQQALANTYGEKVVPGGPVYRSWINDGKTITITFDDVGSGLVAQGGEPLKRFAIAGEDKQFVEAQAVIVGNTVVVSSDKVANPAAVRYAWADNPTGCNLFNKEGFPASPFRTDYLAPVE